MKYDREVTVKVSGDKTPLTPSYISFGRKLLAQLAADMAASERQHGVLTRRLSDGARVSVKAFDGVRIIEVEPPPLQEEDVPGEPLPTGLFLEPFNSTVTNGWGPPFYNENGELINPPMGTEGGTPNGVVVSDYPAPGAVVHGVDATPFLVDWVGDAVPGRLTWDTSPQGSNQTGGATTHTRYMHSPSGGYVYYYGQTLTDVPSPGATHDGTSWIGGYPLCAGAAILEEDEEKFLVAVSTAEAQASYGEWDALTLNVYIRKWDEDGYEGVLPFYDAETNPLGWRLLASETFEPILVPGTGFPAEGNPYDEVVLGHSVFFSSDGTTGAATLIRNGYTKYESGGSWYFDEDPTVHLWGEVNITVSSTTATISFAENPTHEDSHTPAVDGNYSGVFGEEGAIAGIDFDGTQRVEARVERYRYEVTKAPPLHTSVAELVLDAGGVPVTLLDTKFTHTRTFASLGEDENAEYITITKYYKMARLISMDLRYGRTLLYTRIYEYNSSGVFTVIYNYNGTNFTYHDLTWNTEPSFAVELALGNQIIEQGNYRPGNASHHVFAQEGTHEMGTFPPSTPDYLQFLYGMTPANPTGSRINTMFFCFLAAVSDEPNLFVCTREGAAHTMYDEVAYGTVGYLELTATGSGKKVVVSDTYGDLMDHVGVPGELRGSDEFGLV